MSALLSALSRICIIVLVLGGVVITFTQVIGIVIGNPDLVVFAGTDLFTPVTIIAGLAGVFAFLRMYTKQGKNDTDESGIDTDEA